MSRICVLIVDDQALMRAGFRSVLEASGHVEVVGEAATGNEAIEQARRHDPDVVLMDVRMPGMDGIEATRRMPRQKVLILTSFGLDEYIIEALRAGASGFLLNDAPVDELLRAVRAVAAGDAQLSPAVKRLLDQVARRLPAAVRRDAAALAQLTEREREVLRLLAVGMSNAEIGAALVVSEPTIKDARLERAAEARAARSRSGGDLRVRERARDAGWAVDVPTLDRTGHDSATRSSCGLETSCCSGSSRAVIAKTPDFLALAGTRSTGGRPSCAVSPDRISLRAR